jgi:hypothetical protein
MMARPVGGESLEERQDVISVLTKKRATFALELGISAKKLSESEDSHQKI